MLAHVLNTWLHHTVRMDLCNVLTQFTWDQSHDCFSAAEVKPKQTII